MASYNWFLIHHGDGRRGSKVCSRSHGSEVRDSPRVTLHLYLTKSKAMVMDIVGAKCSGSHDIGVRDSPRDTPHP